MAYDKKGSYYATLHDPSADKEKNNNLRAHLVGYDEPDSYDIRAKENHAIHLMRPTVV